MYRFLVVMCAAANCVYGSTLSPPRLAQLRETLKDHQEACVSSANDQLFQLYLPWMRKQMKQDSSLFPTLLRLGSRFEDPALRVSLLSSPIHPPPSPTSSHPASALRARPSLPLSLSSSWPPSPSSASPTSPSPASCLCSPRAHVGAAPARFAAPEGASSKAPAASAAAHASPPPTSALPSRGSWPLREFHRRPQRHCMRPRRPFGIPHAARGPIWSSTERGARNAALAAAYGWVLRQAIFCLRLCMVAARGAGGVGPAAAATRARR